MSIRLDEAFRWSRRWLLICTAVFGMCLVASQVAMDRSLVWYESVTNLAKLLLLATPLLALLSLTSYGLRRLKPSNRQVAGLLRWLAWSTLGAAGLFALCALLAQPDFGGQYQIYERVTLLAQIVFLAALPLLGIVVFSGTALALRRRKKQPSMAAHPMSRIMQRLAPEERDYLQQQLDKRYVGLGSDGELRSLDDLLDARDEDEAADSHQGIGDGQ